MGKKLSHYDQIIKLLYDLKKEYPNYLMGQHISTALGEYGDLWNVTDKEFAFALEKYKTEMEFNIVSDQEVDKIVKDGQNLDKLFQEEEEQDDY
jgi:hypothetical protein